MLWEHIEGLFEAKHSVGNDLLVGHDAILEVHFHLQLLALRLNFVLLSCMILRLAKKLPAEVICSVLLGEIQTRLQLLTDVPVPLVQANC